MDTGLCGRRQRSWRGAHVGLVVDRGLLAEPGVTANGVVAVQPAETGQAGFAFVGERAAALQGLAFEAGVERLARALSAELPTLLIDCRTPAAAQAAAKAREVYCAP